MAQRHGGARPGAGRKTSDPRTARLNVRSTPDRLSAFREAAARANRTLTEWVEEHLTAAASKR